jgi:photosystem II PsbY protein
MPALAVTPATNLRATFCRLSSRQVRAVKTVRASFEKVDVRDAVVKTTAFASLATTMLASGNAQAAQEVMNIAAGDGRAGLLILPMTAALGWVGFNILQPALNQLDDMKTRSAVVGLGLGAATLLAAQDADAAQQVADLAAGDGRAGLLFVPLLAALGWVGFNILQPALNQLDEMKNKSVAVGLGLSAATLLAAQDANAAQQVADLAAGDSRGVLLFLPLTAALGWVGFNILQPALNQFDDMKNK